MKFEGFLVKIADKYLSWRNKHEMSGQIMDVVFVSAIAAGTASLLTIALLK